ncbi:hypothetical protein A2U01_0062780 [Trifolium medium]|uniref:Uncharacterized protein n=1 Tax=Trifolium medium TaxID=97028 RepID=A0A392RZH0_9FABA|nr:hypothetical protein [Trifolium medium]
MTSVSGSEVVGCSGLGSEVVFRSCCSEVGFSEVGNSEDISIAYGELSTSGLTSSGLSFTGSGVLRT